MQVYDENEYANSRLKGTIVRLLDGTPIYVHDIGRLGVRYMRLDEDERRKLDDNYRLCKLKDLDINPVPLGYLNSINNGAIYMTRSPVREDWRQGLRDVSMRAVLANQDLVYRPSHKELAQVIVGTYPKLVDTFDPNLFPNIPVAFSRNFAVANKGERLMYKGRWLVGSIEKNKRYNLLPKFHWVSDELEEELAAA